MHFSAPHPPGGPLSNGSSFISHINCVFASQNTSEERKPRSSGISFSSLLTNTQTEGGLQREQRQRQTLFKRGVHGGRMDPLRTGVVCSCLLTDNWAGWSKHDQLWNYISHWDYKDTGQKWQAPVRAAPQRWRNKTREITFLFLFHLYKPCSQSPTDCSGFALLCRESWCRGKQTKKGGGENKNPKIYIYVYIYIYLYIYEVCIHKKKTPKTSK